MLSAGVLDWVDERVVEEALQEGGELEHLAQLEDEGGEDELEQQQQQQQWWCCQQAESAGPVEIVNACIEAFAQKEKNEVTVPQCRGECRLSAKKVMFPTEYKCGAGYRYSTTRCGGSEKCV